jgi:hypothetical protein
MIDELLNVITVGQPISDNNNQMLNLSELPFPLNEAKTELKQLNIQLITLSVITLTGAYCTCILF